MGPSPLAPFLIRKVAEHPVPRTKGYSPTSPGWWFEIWRNIFIFIPIWGKYPIWRAYFSDGLVVQPPTSLYCNLFLQDIVQFSSDIYYCSEAEGNVRVEAGTFWEWIIIFVSWLSSKFSGNMLDTLLGGPRDQFWNAKLQRVKVVRLGEDEDECSVPWPPLGGSREVERPYELT